MAHRVQGLGFIPSFGSPGWPLSLKGRRKSSRAINNDSQGPGKLAKARGFYRDSQFLHTQAAGCRPGIGLSWCDFCLGASVLCFASTFTCLSKLKIFLGPSRDVRPWWQLSFHISPCATIVSDPPCCTDITCHRQCQKTKYSGRPPFHLSGNFYMIKPNVALHICWQHPVSWLWLNR